MTRRASILFSVAARAFIASRASPDTRSAYERDLSAWLVHCDLEAVSPAKPTLACSTSFRDNLLARQVRRKRSEKMKAIEPTSVRRTLAALSAIYKSALAGESPAASWNPFTTQALPWPQAPAFGVTRAVSDDVAKKMLEIAKETSPRDAAVLAVLYSTGLRRKPVSRLLRTREKLFRVRGTLVARVTVKGGQEVEVEIPSPFDATLATWLDASESEWVFPAARGRGSIHPSTVNRIVEEYATAVGAVGVHPHAFRAAFVTGLYDAGLAERDIQAAVHHRDPRSTQRYDRGKRGAGATKALAKFREEKK